MKTIIALILIFLPFFVYAQTGDCSNMTKDQLNAKKSELTAQKNSLQSDYDKLNNEVKELVNASRLSDAMIQKAEEDFYFFAGATKQQIALWRSEFESLEKAVRSNSISKEDADKKFTSLSTGKIKCLPEFWERWNAVVKMNEEK